MTAARARRPTPAELAAARAETLPDLIAPALSILFCGINPSLYSAAVGHHFARPGNRFWPALWRSGLTRRQLEPHEESELLAAGIGITNVVARATAAASELSAAELADGARELALKLEGYRPATLAVLGLGAFRSAFGRAGAAIGPQPEGLRGTRVWLLPNPSGLNAHYQLADLARLFAELAAEPAGAAIAGRAP